MIEPLAAAFASPSGCQRSATLAAMNFAADTDAAEQARRRLASRMLAATQLLSSTRRAAARNPGERARLRNPPDSQRAGSSIVPPFELTGDQRKAIATIAVELEGEAPDAEAADGGGWQRQDVVAPHASCALSKTGAAAALMVPTETLANNTSRPCSDCWSVRSLADCGSADRVDSAERRADTLADRKRRAVADRGHACVIESDVRFRELAVVVIDEQHRFRVRRRAALDEKEPAPPPPC